MANLALLEKLLNDPKVSNAVENAVENAVDDEFDQIVSYIEQEKTSEATKLIENVFAKGVPDFRLITFYFYAHFSVHGIKSFSETFPKLILIVNEHWNVIRPLDRKAKHVESSLNWFFSQVLNKLKYCEKLQKTGKVHPIWKKSIQETSSEDFEKLVLISRTFLTFFTETWPKSPTKERVLHLVKKIEEFRSLIVQEEVQEEKAQEEKVQEDEIEVQEQTPLEEPSLEALPEEKKPETLVSPIEFVDSPFASIAEELLAPPILDGTSSPTHEGLPKEVHEVANTQKEENEHTLFLQKLEELSRKMKIFELLIGQNNYLKAAVVARDIDRLLEEFDPLNYFPKLFAKHFSLFAKHVTALSEQYDRKDTLQVKSLEKLYRADLDMFVEW